MQCDTCDRNDDFVKDVQMGIDTVSLCFSCWAGYFIDDRIEVNLMDLKQYLSPDEKVSFCKSLKIGPNSE